MTHTLSGFVNELLTHAPLDVSGWQFWQAAGIHRGIHGLLYVRLPGLLSEKPVFLGSGPGHSYRPAVAALSSMITAIDINTALVVIDLQKGIVRGETAHPAETVVAHAAVLVAAFRRNNLPIVIVNVNPVGASWTKARVDQPSVPKSNLAQKIAKAALPMVGFTDIVPELGALPTDIFITKQTWNAFYNTSLHATLQELGVTGIVLAGISTSIGVEGTARAASELGYNISFATDAMTDRVADAHENSLQYIFPRIGETGTTAAIIEKLEQRK